MTEEKPTPQAEDKSTPPVGSESEDAEFLKLLGDENEDPEDDPIKKLDAKLDRVVKGVAKAFSQQGRKEPKEAPKEVKQQVSPVIQNLYFKNNPEVETIWDEVKAEAERLQKDPFELYESSSYFKGEARARLEAKRVEEETKARVGAPSSGVGGGNAIPFDQIDLNKKEHTDWLKSDPKRVEDFNEWLKSNYRKL